MGRAPSTTLLVPSTVMAGRSSTMLMLMKPVAESPSSSLTLTSIESVSTPAPSVIGPDSV